MRLSIAGAVLLGMVHGAAAADYGMPVLRGSMFDQPQHVDVSGFYAGGHIGYASTNFRFGGELVGDLLRDTVIE